MTLPQPSHRLRAARAGALRCAAIYSILIGVDAIGEFPYHLRDGEMLPTERVRWRLVAQTDDDDEATRIMDTVARRIRQEPPRAIDWDALPARSRSQSAVHFQQEQDLTLDERASAGRANAPRLLFVFADVAPSVLLRILVLAVIPTVTYEFARPIEPKAILLEVGQVARLAVFPVSVVPRLTGDPLPIGIRLLVRLRLLMSSEPRA